MNIIYNNKTYIIPPPFDRCYFGSQPINELTIINPYTGTGCKLPAFAVAIYDTIQGTNMTLDDDLRQEGIEWFEKNFNAEYFILLD